MNNKHLYIHAVKAAPLMRPQLPIAPLSCEINAAQLVCLLGQRINTLNAYMQMLAGMSEPVSGYIDYTHNLLDNVDEGKCSEIAYLYHNTALLSFLNGIDNVKLPALYHQIASAAQIDKDVRELVSELEYEANYLLLPAFMTTLQRRYLLIVRAIILKPKILFIENPFANLDREEVRIFGKYLSVLVKNKNITVIISNANLDFVQSYADQMIYITSENIDVFSEWRAFSHFIAAKTSATIDALS